VSKFFGLKNYLSLVKFSHTIFAMPFAMLGFMIGTKTEYADWDWPILLLVVLCMIFARSAAMAFNRYLDRDIDAKNPRTAVREIPAGVIAPKSAMIFTIANCLLFVLTTWFINETCFYLSWVALAVVLGYSFTKRFTPLCHFVLGLGLALAPIGAFLAITNRFDLLPIMLGVAVFLWVSGFDIIYALQDEEFDKSQRLKSIPAYLGRENALRLSEAVHAICGVLVAFFVWKLSQGFDEVGALSWAGVVFFWALLFYQHFLIKPNDLSKVNLAFFTTNGIASLVFCAIVIVDLIG